MSTKINFFHPKFQTKVLCSCVADDDCHPTNLISENLSNRNRGFMAYNVVKPPITLTFNLPMSINISLLKIWPVLGSLRSTGFEVSVLSLSEKECLLVGKCKDVDSDIIEFVYTKKGATDPTAMTRQIQFYSSSRVCRALQSATSVQLKITSTRKCPPVLSKVELWGSPANQLNTFERDTCYRLWQQIMFPADANEQTETASLPSNRVLEVIPEEYLDSITYDVMQFPMRLPCGKVVDQSTIEKHSSVEAKWGRPASDPFTGKDFTDKIKPILDAALKSRIDKFLIENAHNDELKSIPRTLGKRQVEAQNIHGDIKCSNLEESFDSKRHKTELPATQTPEIIPIEDAVQLALNKIRQRAATSRTIASDRQLKCSVCGFGTCLYKISACNHLICKQCFSFRIESKVCFCDAHFVNSDIQRIFQ